MKTPKKLYKFCPIGVNSLRAISEAEVYHASPATFNDPLDCNPTIQIDVSNDQLVKLVMKMLVQFEEIDKINGWLDTIHNEPFQEAPIAKQERLDYVRGEMASKVKELLTLEFSTKGVLSLSAKWDEPLLWSHYAAQHHGICIEYDTTKFDVKTLAKVNYRAPRSVSVNDLFRWKMDGDDSAKRRVYETYFLAKASEWEYEGEWRDVSEKVGVNALHFYITGIYFGMRCDPVWKRAICKLLNQNHEIALYEVMAKDTTFELDARPVNRDALEAIGIQQPPFKIFGDILDSNLRDLPDPTNNVIASLLRIGQEAIQPAIAEAARLERAMTPAREAAGRLDDAVVDALMQRKAEKPERLSGLWELAGKGPQVNALNPNGDAAPVGRNALLPEARYNPKPKKGKAPL